MENNNNDMRAIEVMQFNQERMDLGIAAPLKTPLVIYVEPSSYCNLECTFCPQHITPDTIHKKNMTVETFKKMIPNIKASIGRIVDAFSEGGILAGLKQVGAELKRVFDWAVGETSIKEKLKNY